MPPQPKKGSLKKRATAASDYRNADIYLKKMKALIDKYPNALDMKAYNVYSNKIDSLLREGSKKEIKSGIIPRILREGYKTGGAVKSKKK